ncbi:MAG: PKD domain-containing protein, partial [Bacteroidales bacterium]|nr:PKD domain-containing protein [Bacteroidales bacterium]
MKRLLTILPILSLLVISCQKDPYADAIINPNPAYIGEEITFNNISLNAEAFEWNMGDGTTSSGYNVVYTYYDPGLYLVSLKAFGTRSGVSTASFEVDVIGEELKVIVKEYWDDYVLPNASVILYPTLQDWLDETNMVDEQFTNGVGECMFTNLSYQHYWVDVWEQDHDNYSLASEDEGFIKTQLMEPFYEHTFIAYVDYYEPSAKKATSRSSQKELIME